MPVNPSKATVGQKAIDTRTWNSLVDMLSWWQRTQQLGSPKPKPPKPPHETDIIYLQNDTGAEVAKYSVLKVGAYLLEDQEKERQFYGGSKPTHGGNLVAAIQETADDGAIVRAQIGGIGAALVNVGATWHKRARPTYNAVVLTSGLFGPFEILGTLTDTGEQTCFCRIGHSSNRPYIMQTTSAITAAAISSSRLDLGSGTAKVFDPYQTETEYEDSSNSITIYNMSGSAIGSGGYVLVAPTEDWLPLVVVELCDQPV